MNTLIYRSRIYEKYASNFQDASSVFNSEASKRWGTAYDYYLRDWLPAKKDANIVDVACGGGKLLHFFKQRDYTRLNGVDISHSQVQLARQVVSNVTEANVLEFLEANLNTFDLIVGLDIIEHFYKDEVLRFLDSCYAALKPGGRLILQTPNAESQWGSTHRYNDFTHEVGFNSNALKRLMHLCGFTDTEARELCPVPWSYSLKSSTRYILWQIFRLRLKFWNIVETGDSGSGIFTRVFIMSAVKK